MLIQKLILILIFFKLYFNRIQGKETMCFINGQKSLNVVNERFLSFSIDPAMLLTGFNLSSMSLELAQSLSPAFIRIAGPSTEFLKFSKNDAAVKSFFENTNNITVTPVMWKSVNYWIKAANLTPVFAISDKNRINGSWNPTSILPLLDLSEEMNLTCYWQLGHDCNDKSIVQYKHDLFTLKQILEEYSSNSKYWKIVGSDLQQCLARKNPELARKTLEFLDDVTDAVIWQGQFGENPRHFMTTPMPVWLVVPELTQPTRFSSGLLWAKQIGDAARAGYEVIFRQPSLDELSSVTPVYWISLIYKMLMGRNVLEVRTNSIPEANVNIYAQCTKNQDNYPKQGAVTIFVVNNSTSQHTTSLRVALSHPGSIEVDSYIITSDGADSVTTYLNGKKLSLDNIRGKKFHPTLRRVQVNRHLNLLSPPKSIVFFVIPSAKMPVCIRREKEFPLLAEKLEHDHSEQQDIELKAQIPKDFEKTFNLHHLTYQITNEEHRQKTLPIKNPTSTIRQQIPRQQVQPLKEFPRFLMKRPDVIKKKNDKTTKMEIVLTERPAKDQAVPNNIKTVELELTNDEIKKILTDRAKSKVSEDNLEITSQELENILKDAAEKVGENTTIIRERKRFAVPNILRTLSNKTKNITKRDINMELLDLQSANKKDFKGISLNNQQIEATIRKVGETSEELLKDFEKSEEKHDVFAELASSSENYEPAGLHQNDGKFSKPFDRKSYLADLLTEADIPKKHWADILNREDVPKEKLNPGAKYLDERIRFLMEPSGTETLLPEDLNDYHAFHENLRFQKMVNSKPKFSNEIRNMERTEGLTSTNTLKSPFNKEMGELYAVANQGQKSSGTVGSSINNGFTSHTVHHSLFAKPNAVKIEDTIKPQSNLETEWYAVPRQQFGKISSGSSVNYREIPLFGESHVVKIQNVPSSITAKSQIDVGGEWFGLTKGNQGVISPEVARSSIHHGFASKIREKLKNPLLTETEDRLENASITSARTVDVLGLTTPLFNVEWKGKELSQKNNEIIQNPLSEIIKLVPEAELWQISSANPLFNVEIEKGYNKKPMETGGFSVTHELWETNSIPQENSKIPSDFSTVKPQINVKIEKWDTSSSGIIDKPNPPSSQKIWEINSFPDSNKTISKPGTNEDMWKMDIFSQKNKEKKEAIPTFEEVTTSSNRIWELNAFSSQNSERIENPSFRNIQTEKPHINVEIGHWDTLSVPNKTNNSRVSVVVELGVYNGELENSSSVVENSWDTFFQEINQNPEVLMANSNRVSKLNKPLEDPKTSFPSKTETIAKGLEYYFCDPKNGNTKDKLRFKRDNSNITNDDIKNYKKFMVEQLRAMKKAKQSHVQVDGAPKASPRNLIAKSKSKLLPPVDSKDDNLSSSDGEHLHIVIGKPYDPEKLHINERRRAKQVQKLQQRLQNRKKMNEKIRERKLQQNEVSDDRLESSRPKRAPYNVQTNEVSDKKLNWNIIGKHYKRRMFGTNTWNRQNIFKTKKVPSHSVEIVDKREFLQRTAPFLRNKFKETQRHKRSVHDEIDSSENEIDNYSFIKNKKFKKFLEYQRTSTETTLQNKISTESWIETTQEELNKNSINILEDVVNGSTHLHSVTEKTTHDLVYNSTQKPEEKVDVINTEIFDAIVQPHFIDMIVNAVNSTVTSFVHLTEKISNQFSF